MPAMADNGTDQVAVPTTSKVIAAAEQIIMSSCDIISMGGLQLNIVVSRVQFGIRKKVPKRTEEHPLLLPRPKLFSFLKKEAPEVSAAVLTGLSWLISSSSFASFLFGGKCGSKC